MPLTVALGQLQAAAADLLRLGGPGEVIAPGVLLVVAACVVRDTALRLALASVAALWVVASGAIVAVA